MEIISNDSDSSCTDLGLIDLDEADLELEEELSKINLKQIPSNVFNTDIYFDIKPIIVKSGPIDFIKQDGNINIMSRRNGRLFSNKFDQATDEIEGCEREEPGAPRGIKHHSKLNQNLFLEYI